MNVFKNTKTMKKFILVIIFLILFNVCYPKQVHAVLEWEDVVAAPCKIIFMIESGILEFLDNIFCDKEHQQQDTQYVSPESIIKGKFVLMDPNIFQEVKDGDSRYYDSSIMSEGKNDEGEFGTSILDGKNELRKIIAGWYYALRNLAIVALLSVLVYVGIRMIISSVSQDKAKYKMMLKDWFIALCLLFAMHYIMTGILNISSQITDAIGTSGQNINFTEKSMKIIDEVTQENTKIDSDGNKDIIDNHYTWKDEEGKVGKAGELYDIADGYAQCVMLAGIIGYTLIFAIKYLKRMITIVFLILLAPITCVTYPIDKIGDGKAQAYNRWFQEFLYNVIIQPFHLLIYVVLVGSATTLANTNVLYGIMCFAVMIPAEKLIKEMFGFKDKLGSPLGAFAGGALASQLMNKAFSGGTKNSQGNKVEGKSESDEGIRENKLKPGMPGEENGTGNPTIYDSDIQDNSDETRQQTLPSENTEDEESQINTQNGSQTMVDDNGMVNADMDAYMNANNNNNTEQNQVDEGDSGEKSEESTDNESEDEKPNSEKIYNPNASKVSNALNAVREHRDKKLMAKYGTKNRGILYKDANGRLRAGAFGKYLGKKATSVGKKSIKGATTIGMGLGMAAFGAMFGQGKAGLAAGAALGAKTGDGINNTVSKTTSTVGEYGKEAIYATKTEEQRRKERIQKAMENPDQIEKASRSFSKRNNGKIANTDELNQELANRVRFKETGLSDDQVDDAMQIYENNIEDLGEDGAFQMAYASADLGSRYSAEAFDDPKKVKNMYDGIMRTYKNLGVNQDLADENARNIISNAASTKGVKNPALMVPSRKEAYKSNADNIAKAKASYARRHGINESKVKKAQLDQELEMGFNLRKAGISEEDRDKFFDEYLSNTDAINEVRADLGADAKEDAVNDELERRFEIKIKAGIENEKELSSHIHSAKEHIKNNENIQKASNGKVCSEVKQRVTVKDSYHISSSSMDEMNSKISEIRNSEAKFIKDSADKDGAKKVIETQRYEASMNATKKNSDWYSKQGDYQRNFMTKYSSREMGDSEIMEQAKKKIVKQLGKENFGSNKSFREKFADEVILKSKKMCGIEEK